MRTPSYGGDRFFTHEAFNHYITLDGRNVTLRAVALVDWDRQGRIEQLRVTAYSGQTPLWSNVE